MTTTKTWSTKESGDFFSVEVIKSTKDTDPDSTVTVKVNDIRPVTRDSRGPVGGHMVLTDLAQVTELAGLLERAKEEAAK